jgi:hypothetical protein
MKFKGLFLIVLSSLAIGLAGCSKDEAADAGAGTGAPAVSEPLQKPQGAVGGNTPPTVAPAPPGVQTGTPGG